MKTLLIIGGVLLVGGGLLVFGSRDTWNFSKPATSDSPRQNSNSEVKDQNITDDDAVLGVESAPVTLVEFGDYQCTFCTRFFKESEGPLIEKYVKTGKLKIVFRDFVVNGKESQNAALAAECAGDQGRYWDYHDKLYTERRGYNAGTFNKDNLISFVRDLGLNQDQFRECYEDQQHRDEIVDDTNAAYALGGNGTPTFFLNGKLVPGAQPLHVFENLIEQALLNN